MKFKPPYLGAAYYPEDWPLEQIDDDIALMKQAGMNVMRIAEFAWSRMEPYEGKYDFDWLHLTVDKLAEAGIATIMCTPTCTPPAWLSERYPEILVVGEYGIQAQHGSRRHACPNSPVYRAHSARITRKLAEEFGNDENVIGWQIDNEFSPSGPHGCFCPVCVGKFREKMRERFGTIENLNETWGTHLWSQTYQSFAQLPPPYQHGRHHPQLIEAYCNFAGDSYVEYAGEQADILHEMTTQPVGTDMMPILSVNYERMHRKLDLVQYNHYNTPETLWEAPFWMDYSRTIKEDVPFWNTETATCWNGSTSANGYREPGFCRVNSWFPYALGGEANLYWLWRAHWSGQELMHGSVVTSCGRPMHIFGEVQEIAAGLEKSGDFLNGTKPEKSGLAVHLSTAANWIFLYQRMTQGFDYRRGMIEKVYQPMIQAQIRPDIIDPAASLDDYTVVFSPFLPTLEEGDLVERLKAWIEGGGTWIVGPMSDVRTIHGTKYQHAPFGVLEDWAGIYCTMQIPGTPRDFRMKWDDGRESEGSVWYDGFELRGAESMATYTEGPFEGDAAVAVKSVGKGRIIVLGTLPQDDMLVRLLTNTGITPAAKASPSILAVPRSGEAGEGMTVLEFMNQPGTLTLDRPATDILTGEQHSGEMDIAPYAVHVLKY